MRKYFLLLLFFIFASYVTAADVKNISTVGEASIIEDDIASAKLQAVARAKWLAIESVSGVKVKVDTIVQNAVLVDEAVKSEIKGVIENYKIVDEGKSGDVYWVKINAQVSPSKAQKAVGLFSRNTSIAVMLPVIFPNKSVDDSTIFSEKVINELSNQGIEVIDLAANHSDISLYQIDAAVKNSNFSIMRNIAYKYMSGAMLIGKVESNVTAHAGKNVGYGINLPFDIVTGRLTYRLVGDKDGQKVIVASGAVSGRGQGATVEDATHSMLENLAESFSNELISTVMEKLKGINSKNIEIILAGNSDINKLLELKNDLNFISWVLSAEDKGIDKILVQYPEKSIYLANAIKSIGKYSIKNFSNYKIILEYR